MFYPFDLLIILMSFTCKHNDIPRLPIVNGIGDGFFPVTDLNIVPRGLINAGFNIFYNILGFLKPRIIGCDNGKVRIGSADFPHLKPPELRAVSPQPNTLTSLFG